jgi:hypothetical protein
METEIINHAEQKASHAQRHKGNLIEQSGRAAVILRRQQERKAKHQKQDT